MKRVFETAECEAVKNSILWGLRYEKHKNQNEKHSKSWIQRLSIFNNRISSRLVMISFALQCDFSSLPSAMKKLNFVKCLNADQLKITLRGE